LWERNADAQLPPASTTKILTAILAIESGRLDEERIEGALQRREHWAKWAAIGAAPAAPKDESAWAKQLAERTVHPIGGMVPSISSPVRVIVVDDDLGGPYPPPSREPFLETLRESGVRVVTDESDPEAKASATLIAVYGDIRAWKGRPGYSEKAIKRVRELVDAHRKNGVSVVLFSHPRLAPSLALDVPTLCAWGGEGVMQRAAARVLARNAAR
jgi:hypothetical protein